MTFSRLSREIIIENDEILQNHDIFTNLFQAQAQFTIHMIHFW